ncbi:MAG: CPBP family intramembrane metalloprotease [Clostridiaceae bacterium]|nr:CPBP family intramembrane metalloprotease [Clostridiaceae bacterium]
MREKNSNSVQRPSASDIVSAFAVPLLGAALYYSVQFFVIVAFSLLLKRDVIAYSGTISLIYGLILLVVFCFAVYLTNLKNPKTIPFKRMSITDIGLGTFFALGLIGISTIYFISIQILSQYIGTISEAINDYVEMVSIQSKLSNRETVLFSVATVIFIPVIEELLFRGLIQGSFMKVLRPIPAIILSSLIFGLIHVQPIQVGYAFICGLAIGSVYYLSGNILVSIWVHLVFNFFGSAVVTLFGDQIALLTWIERIELISIGIVAGSLVYYYRKKKSNSDGALNEAKS